MNIHGEQSRTMEIFTDGACRGNPGPAGIGVVISRNGRVIKRISKSIGPATNNLAEYTALIYALQEALVLKALEVKVSTDSELLYHQIKGRYKIKNEKLKILFDQVQHLIRGFKRIDFECIPREKNREADRLAIQAVKKIQKKQARVVAPTFRLKSEAGVPTSDLSEHRDPSL